ncbi:hypothetical protein DICVIV_06339 [Dictyocaulus viviparus]|uniref:Uncharacterized protein n=1 Tax=Dictyocaulus viviparus TaxID=29172 RepID=A0A0D8XUS7_DICVI|nr:hypothetical protein DICVIV_06339 [Dictyocaulus viviparus]
MSDQENVEHEHGGSVPGLMTEENAEIVKEKDEEKKDTLKCPPAPEFPLADRVKELKLDVARFYPTALLTELYTEPLECPAFYEDLKTKPSTFYKDMKDLPDYVAKKYIPDISRRYIELERRIKLLESTLWALPREDRSLEEDRFEILTELLDKACQGFEIWDEHVERNIKYGHRVVLEARLLHLIESKFDIIEKICAEFDKLKGDQHGVNNEREVLDKNLPALRIENTPSSNESSNVKSKRNVREYCFIFETHFFIAQFLRYEIRHCDLMFTEIHESFLKSYLEMDW